MWVFMVILVAFFVCLAIYTIQVITNHGLGLFSVFFGDMAKLGWAGQLNADFMAMLGLSAAWVVWRNQFSLPGIILGVIAFFVGAPFLCAYLLFLCYSHKADVNAMLVGNKG